MNAVSIYKACDIRGVFPGEVDQEQAYLIGRAVGTILGGHPAAVAGDARESTPVLKAEVIRGLLESGSDVIDLGTVPTPAFYYGLKHERVAGGIMVTASHNPREYNGFKVALGREPIREEDIEQIAHLVRTADFRAGSGTLSLVPIIGRYESFLRGLLPTAPRSLRIVVDGGNGVAGDPAVQLFREAGHEVIPLFCQPDGSFPNRPPNPAVFENLTALCQAVLGNGADLGIAFDGDGDRVVFVDELGCPVPSEKVLILFARAALKSSPGGKVVYDQKCSCVVLESVLALGGVPVREKSGHAFIKRTFLQKSAVLAGEISGHFFFPELGGDDGIYAALKMVGMLSAKGEPLGVETESVPSYSITPDIRIPWSQGREELLACARQGLGEFPLDSLDGVRVDFPDGWALLRISVTEPVVTLRFEGRDEGFLHRVIDRFLQGVPQLTEPVRNYLDRRNRKG